MENDSMTIIARIFELAYRSFRRDIDKYISKHNSGELTDTEFINDIKRAFECLHGCDEDYYKKL